MRNTLIQGSLTVASFFIVLLIASQVNWMSVLRIRKITDSTENKLGNYFWDAYQKIEDENKNPLVLNSVDSIVSKICEGNHINRESVTVHVLNKDDINAFALPGGHLVVYTGLIKASESPEELSGVLGHEIAHIELNHVMKKLIKEVGLSALISMTTGRGGSETIKKTAKMLSSTAFERKLEKEADIQSVDYLLNAHIKPEPFAQFMYRLAEKEGDSMSDLSWITTHPESKERAAYILEYCKGKAQGGEPVLNPVTWHKLQASLTQGD